MMIVLHIVLSIMAFSAIIFLHEMGHFLAALWAGMKVETFSIGFGRPLIKWQYKGTQWQVGWIPVGGYVRIAGMGEEEEKQEVKSSEPLPVTPPWKRMVVVAMGPLVNIVLAWLLFAGIWALGGQGKFFNETSSLVGCVDPSSEMAKVIAPGDLILAYDDKPVLSAKEHIYSPMLSKDAIKVSFEKIDYDEQTFKLTAVDLKPYPHPESLDKAWKTLGLLAPARILQIQEVVDQAKRFEGSLANRTIHAGDILMAVNGVRVFSEGQLVELLNNHEVLLGIEREGKVQLVRVPTFPLAAFDLSPQDRLELSDWSYECISSKGSLEKIELSDCRWIPYNLDARGVVEHPYGFIEGLNPVLKDFTLRKGDRVVSVQGRPFAHARELLLHLQQPTATLYFKKGPAPLGMEAMKAQEWLVESMMDRDLESLLEDTSLGSCEKGEYYSLVDIRLLKRSDLANAQIAGWKERAKRLPDERQRVKTLEYIEKKAQEWTLGVQIQDLQVMYNPTANEQFLASLSQITRTLNSLLTGHLSPKWLSGPVGMMTMMTQGMSSGLVKAFQLLAIISLNLGIFNLLPLPFLDGGRLIIDGFEVLTGKKMNPRVLEMVSYVCIALFIGLVVFSTYWDLSRLWALLG